MNKKIKLILLVCLGIILLFIGNRIFNKKNNEENNNSLDNQIGNEYTPLEEITGEQARQTTVSLYFKSKITGELIPIDMRIDSKNLLDNPYKYLVELLIEKPSDEELESTIPEDTKVIAAVINGTTVEIDFSKDFIEKHTGTKEEEQKTIDSIVKTLTQLNEVEKIKILIEGKENREFNDKAINFKQAFSN